MLAKCSLQTLIYRAVICKTRGKASGFIVEVMGEVWGVR